MLVIPSGRRAPIQLRYALVVPSGRRAPIALGPVETGPEIPDPEIVGDLAVSAGLRWGGLEASLRGWRVAPARLAMHHAAMSVGWGGLAGFSSSARVQWGGLSLQHAAWSQAWHGVQAGHVSALWSSWDSNPIIGRESGAGWAYSRPLLRQAYPMPWSVPPRQADAARLCWGGHVARTLGYASPWRVPPKFEAPVRVPWGSGRGLAWVVRPPRTPPAPPGQAQSVDGRAAAIAFRCREFKHPPMRVPLRIGNLACYSARDLQRAYVVLNTIEVVRLPDLLPIKVDSIALGSGRDTWCWDASLQLADHAQLSAVQPTAEGPRKLRITINGYVWVIAIEAFDQSRAFGQVQVGITGRSATAQLAEPYAAARSSETANARTMHQLADAEVDGSDIGVQYDAVDWLVTGGAWYYDSLTPMAALLRIAEGSGAVVQSHPSAPEVRIVPRYPVSPWAWPETAPDVEIQDDIITGTRLQLQSRPNFDAVIVAGERVGVAARVVREGEAGQTYAPQQVDQLITDADGARERGRNVISDRGGQALVEEDIPLFPAPLSAGQPGLVLPLRLVRRIAGEGTWHGLSTAVRINAVLVKTPSGVVFDVTQTVTIERHYTDAD